MFFSYARFRRNSPRSYVFKTTDIKILPGYPKITTNGAVEVKLYVAVPGTLTGPKNLTGSQFTRKIFNVNIVKKSLEDKTYMSSYGFQIQSVEVMKARNENTSQIIIVSKTWMIVVAVLASFLFLCLMAVAYLYWHVRR